MDHCVTEGLVKSHNASAIKEVVKHKVDAIDKESKQYMLHAKINVGVLNLGGFLSIQTRRGGSCGLKCIDQFNLSMRGRFGTSQSQKRGMLAWNPRSLFTPIEIGAQ